MRRFFVVTTLLVIGLLPAITTAATEAETCASQSLTVGVRGLPPNDSTCYQGILDAQNKTNGISCLSFSNACCTNSTGQLSCPEINTFVAAPASSVEVGPPAPEKKSPIIFDPELTIPFFPSGAVDGTTFAKYIRAIFTVFIWSVGVLATVMVIYGGIRWVAAAGDASRINQAKDIIYNAIIGLVIALTSVVLLNLIDPRLAKFEGLSATESTQVVGIPYHTDVALGENNEAGAERPDPTDPSKTIGGCKTRNGPIVQENTCSVGGLSLTWPVGSAKQNITSRVGPRKLKVGSSCHPGTDFATDQVTGKPILAPADGKVTSVVRGAGESIIRFDGKGYYLRILHVKSAVVQGNTNVRKGELLGYSGGNPKDSAEIAKWSGGPHVHIEMYLSSGILRDMVPCLGS